MNEAHELWELCLPQLPMNGKIVLRSETKVNKKVRLQKAQSLQKVLCLISRHHYEMELRPLGIGN